MKLRALLLPALALALAVSGCKKEDKPAAEKPAAYCDFAEGPEAAPVKVVAYYPGGHEDTLAAIKDLLGQYPGKVHVQIVDWRHEEGRKLRDAAQLSCAGVTINGKNVFELERDGKKDSIAFTRGLSKGDWKAEDLKAAVEQELAKGNEK